MEKNLNQVLINQLKWRSRRSMLELDLYFERFINKNGLENLTGAELNHYQALLEFDDDLILAFFQNKKVCDNQYIAAIIAKII